MFEHEPPRSWNADVPDNVSRDEQHRTLPRLLLQSRPPRRRRNDNDDSALLVWLASEPKTDFKGKGGDTMATVQHTQDFCAITLLVRGARFDIFFPSLFSPWCSCSCLPTLYSSFFFDLFNALQLMAYAMCVLSQPYVYSLLRKWHSQPELWSRQSLSCSLNIVPILSFKVSFWTKSWPEHQDTTFCRK